MNRSDLATPRCPGSLKEGFDTYCPAVLRRLFSGKRVFHVLPGSPEEEAWEHASVPSPEPALQRWYRLRLDKNKLLPDPHGAYLLKTAASQPLGIRFPFDQAANEHLCMQLAAQVFGIPVLPNALIFFSDGKPAIIYRDRPIMDAFLSFEACFIQAWGAPGPAARKKISFQTHASLIDRFGAASLVLRDWYFRVTVFLWLVANGEGHAKNCGLLKTTRGDFGPAPLWGVSCMPMHRLAPEMSLPGGLYEGDTQSPGYREIGHYSRVEFESFGNRIHLPEARVRHVLDELAACRQDALLLAARAFLPAEAESVFRYHFSERIARLR